MQEFRGLKGQERGVWGRFSLFSEWKILFLAKVIELSNLENTYKFFLAHANFNCNSREINYKSYILLQFLRYKCLKLGSYVLGTKTTFLIETIFDLGLRGEHIKVAYRLKLTKNADWNFQNSIFTQLHFWGLNQKSVILKILFWSLEHYFQVSSIYLKNCRRRLILKFHKCQFSGNNV